MNRIDKTVVFKTLRDEHLSQILDIELGMVQQRVLMAAGTNQFVFNCTAAVKEFLLKEGTDPRYGARHLKRAIERQSGVSAGESGGYRTGEAGRLRPRRYGFGEPDDLRERSREHMAPVLLERYGAAAANIPAARAARTAVNGRRDLGASPIAESK